MLVVSNLCQYRTSPVSLSADSRRHQTRCPQAHRNALAAFWNIAPDDTRLSSFVQKLSSLTPSPEMLRSPEPFIGEAIVAARAAGENSDDCETCPSKAACFDAASRFGAQDCEDAWEGLLRSRLLSASPDLVPLHPIRFGPGGDPIRRHRGGHRRRRQRHHGGSGGAGRQDGHHRHKAKRKDAMQSPLLYSDAQSAGET